MKLICKFLFLNTLLFFAINLSCADADKEFVLIDVSGKKVFDDCHIKGAINVPYEAVAKYARNVAKNTEIVLYCTNYRCISSTEAGKLLTSREFKDVSVYEGGVAEWYQLGKKEKGFPVVGPCNQAFLKHEIEKVETDEKDVRVISAQELKNKLEEFVYNRDSSAQEKSFVEKIIDFIKKFFK